MQSDKTKLMEIPELNLARFSLGNFVQKYSYKNALME
jgi:hypothetical protein